MQDIGGEFAIVRADFEDAPCGGFSLILPPAKEAAGEQLSEKRADTYAGVEIPAAPDLIGVAGVIAVFGVVESQIEVIGKRDRTVF